MDKNNYVEKTYLALELTKLTDCRDPHEIYKHFQYFIKQLTGIENLQDMSELQTNYKMLEAMYDELYDSTEVVVRDKVFEKFNKAIKYLDEQKGNMEPYVYDTLHSMLYIKNPCDKISSKENV